MADRYGPLSDMSVVELLMCATSVPWLFGPACYNGRTFIDPDFSPAAREMYQRFKSEASNVLVSNMLVDRSESQQVYVKPHPYAHGRWMLVRDFTKFILGIPNREMTDAIVNGLIQTQAIVI